MPRSLQASQNESGIEFSQNPALARILRVEVELSARELTPGSRRANWIQACAGSTE